MLRHCARCRSGGGAARSAVLGFDDIFRINAVEVAGQLAPLARSYNLFVRRIDAKPFLRKQPFERLAESCLIAGGSFIQRRRDSALLR
jgi:hypothetical protein